MVQLVIMLPAQNIEHSVLISASTQPLPTTVAKIYIGDVTFLFTHSKITKDPKSPRDAAERISNERAF